MWMKQDSETNVMQNKISEETNQGVKTILVVDDEEQILKMVEKALRPAGYNTILTNSGKKALKIFEEQHKSIDLVVLDLMMPEISGEDVFQTIKSIKPSVRTIFISGLYINGHAEELIEKGANGYLQKPFNIAKLTGTIRKALENHK
jgi:two-component system, cell cycle sensor histidine kinase and response regulator CckA